MSSSVVTLLPYAGGLAGLSVAAAALLNYRRDAATKDVSRASVLVDSMVKLNEQLEKSLARAEAALERAEAALEKADAREDALVGELRHTTEELRATTEQVRGLRADVARLEKVISEASKNGT